MIATVFIILIIMATIFYIASRKHKINSNNISNEVALFISEINTTLHPRTIEITFNSNATIFEYYLNDQLVGQSNNKEIEFSGLDPDTVYNIKIVASTNNKSVEKTLTLKTEDDSQPQTTVDYAKINYSNNDVKQKIKEAATHKLINTTESDINQFAKIEGKEYVSQTTSLSAINGINFFSIDELDVSSEIKAEVNSQNTAFYINANNEKIIIGCNNHAHSFSYAFYSLQQLLGIYYLMYHDDGCILPSEKKILNIVDVYKQKIKNNLYGQTYGAYGKGHLAPLIERFKVRNNYLDESVKTAHAITNFYKTYKAEIIESRKDPDNPIMWDHRFLNLNNPRTIELLKEYAHNEAIKNGINGVPVSPADGIGSGEKSTIVLDIKSINENGEWYVVEPKKTVSLVPDASVTGGIQLNNLHEVNYWVCDLMTNHIYNTLPNYNGLTSMNAYGDGNLNVQPPEQTPVHPKMLVQLIPYSFQTFYRPFYRMFEDWQNVAELKGVYDYVSITQRNKNGMWQNIVPQLNSRAQDWFERGFSFDRLKFETTGYSLIIIHFLWVIQQLNNSWNTKTTNELYEEWLTLMFGNAANEMKQFIETNASLSTFPNMVDILSNINKSQLTENEVSRINQYIIYAYYLKLYFNSDYETILNFAFAFQHLGLFQNYSLYNRGNLINKDFSRPMQSINWYIENAEYNGSIDEMMQEMVSEFPIFYENVGFTLDHQKIKKTQNTGNFNYSPFSLAQDAFYFTPEDAQNKISIAVKPTNTAATIYVTDDDILSKTIEFTDDQIGQEVIVEIDDLRPGVKYVLKPNKKFEYVKFTPDAAIMVDFLRRRNGTYNYNYIYLPNNLTELWLTGEDQMNSPNSNTLFEITQDGQRTGTKLTPTEQNINGKRYYKIDIPEQHRGTIMQVYKRYDSISIVNYDAPLSYQLFEYNEN